uniref:putative F-box/LRR-repeat protein 23 n=1 Tax=Erigeron canadensis TaxID=72917 RepID=UPI001CB9B6F3|nr:putative F-box/LRR-repeat protein 23 [Erigeron canadensis]
MDNPPDACGLIACRNICRHVVFRSQGQMVDLSIGGFSDGKLLEYIADRSTQLRRLEVIYCFGDMYGAWGESLKKLSFLEELSLFETGISDKEIEEAGRYCPLLKALKVNIKPYVYCDDHVNDEKYMSERNALTVAIGKTLPILRHLELIGNSMTDTGLKAILDGCRLLESLDLRQLQIL